MRDQSVEAADVSVTYSRFVVCATNQWGFKDAHQCPLASTSIF